MKDKNSARILGRIHRQETKETTRHVEYMELQINCPSVTCGNVRAFCRLWGAAEIETVKASFSSGDQILATGKISQYAGRGGETKTNFNIYTVIPAPDGRKQSRALFTLAGQVVELRGEDDGKTPRELSVLVVREDKTGAKKGEETFKVEFPSYLKMDLGGDPVVGSTYSINGAIRQDEDEFGELQVPSRPVVMGIREVHE